MELCEHWIKAASMSPMLKLTFNTESAEDVFLLYNKNLLTNFKFI